jgi:hypothetical protein
LRKGVRNVEEAASAEVLARLRRALPEFREWSMQMPEAAALWFQPGQAPALFESLADYVADLVAGNFDEVDYIAVRCFSLLESLASSEELELRALVGVSFLGASNWVRLGAGVSLMGPRTLALAREVLGPE